MCPIINKNNINNVLKKQKYENELIKVKNLVKKTKKFINNLKNLTCERKEEKKNPLFLTYDDICLLNSEKENNKPTNFIAINSTNEKDKIKLKDFSNNIIINNVNSNTPINMYLIERKDKKNEFTNEKNSFNDVDFSFNDRFFDNRELFELNQESEIFLNNKGKFI